MHQIIFNILLLTFGCFPTFLIPSEAQTPGCTDPLAINYSSSAIKNNGSCIYQSESVSPILNLNIASDLAETSGIILWQNQIWTHNDNADINIYSLDTLKGNIIQPYPLTGSLNKDWEEISQDDDYLYIGDFGNNLNGNRTDLKILRVSKTSILSNSPVIETINFSYSDQIDFSPTGSNNSDFDCEGFLLSPLTAFSCLQSNGYLIKPAFTLSRKPPGHLSLI